jgi:hypothetical protein
MIFMEYQQPVIGEHTDFLGLEQPAGYFLEVEAGAGVGAARRLAVAADRP